MVESKGPPIIIKRKILWHVKKYIVIIRFICIYCVRLQKVSIAMKALKYEKMGVISYTLTVVHNEWILPLGSGKNKMTTLAILLSMS